jgi:glyoxylase-like metal-dependent hydrolase (beta-lactamase superfamily II)
MIARRRIGPVDIRRAPVESAAKICAAVPIVNPPSLVSGQIDTIAPYVRRLVATNPGFMTGPGTNTYILGRERFVVIDPGPAEPSHIERILVATGRAIDRVLVTHTHGDHSPGAKVLAEATGAPVFGRPPPNDGHQDASFKADRTLEDGDMLEFDAGTIRALHTPGHASNHVCYLLADAGLLFTGDHLMQGSTVVIAPPDGNMKEYLDSLARLQREPVSRLAPGHGLTIEDGQAEIAHIIAHRLKREAKVLAKVREFGPATLDELVTRVYDDVDPRLHALAKGSLLAHLQKLEVDRRVDRADDGAWRERAI